MSHTDPHKDHDHVGAHSGQHHEAEPSGLDALREKSSHALTTTGEAASDLARRTSAGIEANPLSVLVGGIALGVLAGAFVPRSARETQLLAPVGRRLTDTAKGAVDAAKETVATEFDGLGLTRSAARGQVNTLLEGVVRALAAAGTSALTAAREKQAAK